MSLFEGYCRTEFWNGSRLWASEDPDLTPCFQRTLLVWTPCAFLWLFSPVEILLLFRSGDRLIPWTVLNVCKCMLASVTLGVQLGHLVYVIMLHWDGAAVYPVDVITPLVLVATVSLSIIFMLLERRRGVRSSGVQWVFWTLLLLGGIPELRTHIKTATSQESVPDLVPFVLYLVYFVSVAVQWLLQCWADAAPEYRQDSCCSDTRWSPRSAASFLSEITFSWFDRMAVGGWRRPLTPADLWQLEPDDTAAHIAPLFDRHWRRRERPHRRTSLEADGKPGRIKCPSDDVTVREKRRSLGRGSLISALFRSFGGTFVVGALLKFVYDTLTFADPQILSNIIQLVKDAERPAWNGYAYAVLLVLVKLLSAVLINQYFLLMNTTGMRLRTALISAVYRKSLVISNVARRQSTVGEIVNLMSVDANKLMDLLPFICHLWSAPYRITLSVYFLFQELGVPVFAGISVMLVMIPVNMLVANVTSKLQKQQMTYKDQRVKIMHEILSGIKVLKLYAWEKSFERQVQDIRDKEAGVLKRMAYLNAVDCFIWACAPILVCLATFATYVMSDPSHILDSRRAFVSLSLFENLRMPLSMLPAITVSAVQGRVSLKRLSKFLNSDELDDQAVSHDSTEKEPVVVEEGTFTWDRQLAPCLQDISLRAERGSLVAVVGTVGSGKSSLLSAILGEMEKVSGRVNVKGSVAYVAQEAWIQNASLKENVLFGLPLDERRYQRTVDACALRSDLDMLPAGDDTEIGEKGINLSGGQKQRVALARAVYSDSDVYLLDDMLSAVDSHVGKHIFENVIGPNGILKNKTRLLVTHGIMYLPRTDLVVVLRQGRVSESGAYRQLMERRGAFAEFLLQYITEARQDTEKQQELDEIKQQLEEKMGREEVERRMSPDRHHSEPPEHGRDTADRARSLSVESGDMRRSSQLVTDAASSGEEEQRDPAGRLTDAENMETGKVKMGVYWYYMKAIGVGMALLTLVLYLSTQVCDVAAAIWLARWTEDEAALSDTGRRHMYLTVYGALALGQVVLSLSGAFSLFSSVLGGARLLHADLLHNVLRLPMAFFDTTPLGRIINRFSKDVDVLDTKMPTTLDQFLMTLVYVLGTQFAIIYTTPIFMVVVVPLIGIYYFIQMVYVSTSRQLRRMESVRRSPILSHFSETITGASTIRAFGKTGDFVRQSEEKVDMNQACFYPSMVASRWLSFRLILIGIAITFFATLLAVLSRESIAAGLVGMSVYYTLHITEDLNWLVRMSAELETEIVAVERVKEYSRQEQEAAWVRQDRRPPADWPSQGRLELRDYQTRYRPGLELVLRGISASIAAGERVGIVGRTGAGKSSLTLALFRIIEAAGGEIFLDGVRIADIGLHDLRSRITIIPQDPVLFSGTLRQNLDPFDRYTDTEVWTALEHCHLKTFVRTLPSGLLHEIGEGGGNLSVGQRQLICLGRALLRKTKLLILDEATAAVDMETDALIQATIRAEFADCTVLTIAHRLNTILDNTRVIVLEAGRIREMAPPSQLLADQTSAFYGMAKDAGVGL